MTDVWNLHFSVENKGLVYGEKSFLLQRRAGLHYSGLKEVEILKCPTPAFLVFIEVE